MRLRTLYDDMIPLEPENLKEWEAYRETLLANLRFAAGVDLLKNDCPLNAQIFDAVEYDGFVVEKVLFQSLPGFYVTGNLYRPAKIEGKIPVILNPHGHWDHGRIETKAIARLPQRCANLALRGMAAFIYDMVGYNDSKQVPHEQECPEFERWNYGRFALQTLNSLKAVDFVESLPYCDKSRIGCTGCSGGGTQTYFLTALDPRIAAAAPINMASHHFQGGCICENAPFLRHDYCNVDYTALAAPRPLFLAGADGDWTDHSEEVEYPALAYIYGLYHKKANFTHWFRSAGHGYEKPVRERVYKFFCKAFGIEDPYKGEVDMEFDEQSLLMGDIRSRVPAEGFLDSEEALFEAAKAIIKENLAKQTDEEKLETARRVFALDRYCELDIPYVRETYDDHGQQFFRLGACPAPVDTCGMKYFHCYNPAEDACRISALTNLMYEYPEATFVARGKTAALVELAATLAQHAAAIDVKDPDYSGIVLPGSALVDLATLPIPELTEEEE